MSDQAVWYRSWNIEILQAPIDRRSLRLMSGTLNDQGFSVPIYILMSRSSFLANKFRHKIWGSMCLFCHELLISSPDDLVAHLIWICQKQDRFSTTPFIEFYDLWYNRIFVIFYIPHS